MALLDTLPEVAAARRLAKEASAYAVGGFIRDALLGRPTADLDLALDAEPAPFARVLAATFGGSAFALDEERGAWRVALPPGATALRTVDVTRLRGSIEQDLAARDFTIDAMAAPLRGPRVLVDPFDGAGALARREVRLVSPFAFRDDGLRLLRAVRLAAELDYSIARATRHAMSRDRNALASVAWERRRDELVRLLATPRAAGGLARLARVPLLDHLLPEMEECRGVQQPPEHASDVLTHQVRTVEVLDGLFAAHSPASRGSGRRARVFWGQPAADELRRHFGPARVALLKLAGLLHDVGKPRTRAYQDGRMRFYGHAEVGAEMAREALRRLRFANREVETIALLVHDHLRPGQLARPGEVPTRRALFRFFRDLGPLAPDLLILQFADAEATLGPRATAGGWRRHAAFISAMLAARSELARVLEPRVRLITGHDMMAALGMEPGPRLGRILRAVEEAIGAGEAVDRAGALDLARHLLAADPGEQPPF